ncbi:MAG TPA: dihydroxyacetone kinase phosphoryl donor subunit DhaM [Symbiobacteriaceae bacterium]
MVSLVLVSHSRQLAEGLADLVRQVAGDVPVAAVGGTPDGRLGTDATAIAEAINEVYSDDGVLVLMDLGSSVMAAETALELLTPDRAANVHLCGAPLVEGAVAAGVEARVGGDLARVRAAAESALNHPKF